MSELDYRTLNRAKIGQGKTAISTRTTVEVRNLIEMLALKTGMNFRSVIETAIKEMAASRLSEADLAKSRENRSDATDQGGSGLSPRRHGANLPLIAG